MPRPDPIPSPRHSALRRFWRIMRFMALVSVVTAAIAVVLVVRGSEGAHIHAMIATALGVGLTVFLAGALMGLIFLSSYSGHDELVSRFEETDDK